MQKCTFRVGETAVLRKRSHETTKNKTAKIYFSRRASANFSHLNCFGTGEAKNQPRCKRHRPKILKIVVSCKRNACFCSSAGVRFAAVDPKEELRIAISHCKTWDIVHACFPQMSRNALTSMVGRKGAPHFARFVEAKRRFSKNTCGYLMKLRFLLKTDVSPTRNDRFRNGSGSPPLSKAEMLAFQRMLKSNAIEIQHASHGC